MAESLILKTPENWSGLIMDVAGNTEWEILELSAAHIHNPGLGGVYTSFRELRSVWDHGEFKGYRVDVKSGIGREGDVMKVDSLSPAIILNPVSIDFQLHQRRDLDFAVDLLGKFNAAGYVSERPSSGLRLSIYTGSDRGDYLYSVTMGHEFTHLSHHEDRAPPQDIIDRLRSKYEIVED